MVVQSNQGTDSKYNTIHNWDQWQLADHRVINISLVINLRVSRGKPCKRVKFNGRKLQDPATKEQFQTELTNRFEDLQCDEPTLPISERSESFEQIVKDVAENM